LEEKRRAKVRIRAFRAIDNVEVCRKYIEGHTRILSSVGVTKVTSAEHHWVNNPAAYVILCEDQETGKVFGGARVHACGGNQLLPWEEATLKMDTSVSQHVNKYLPQGTGEFCGLWNSLEVAGLGIGAIYLIRTAFAIIPQLGLNTIWALCSPYTARIARNYGLLKYEDVGNEGTFYYPKIDLLATATLNKNVLTMEDGSEKEREKVMFLREKPNNVVVEENKRVIVEISYELKIDNIDTSVFNFGS